MESIILVWSGGLMVWVGVWSILSLMFDRTAEELNDELKSLLIRKGPRAVKKRVDRLIKYMYTNISYSPEFLELLKKEGI